MPLEAPRPIQIRPFLTARFQRASSSALEMGGRQALANSGSTSALAIKNGRRYLVSLKWQQVSGTAERKVPFEVICLVSAMHHGHYAKAYLVLGGEGWTLWDFITSGGLQEYLKDTDGIRIVTLENFIALANAGKL